MLAHSDACTTQGRATALGIRRYPLVHGMQVRVAIERNPFLARRLARLVGPADAPWLSPKLQEARQLASQRRCAGPL